MSFVALGSALKASARCVGRRHAHWTAAEAASSRLVLAPEEIQSKPALEERWKLGREIQRGRFGIVYESESSIGGGAQKAATKSIVKNAGTISAEVPWLRREISMLKRCEHPLSMRLLDVFEDQSNLHLVSEFYGGGELFDHIVDRGSYSEADAGRLLSQILTAVDHFHSLGVMHRDLKPENIMYKNQSSDDIVVVDFGMATEFEPGQKLDDTVGSLEYAAPEVLAGAHDEKSDVWSVGVILFVLLSGRPPFGGSHEKAVERQIMSGKFSLAGKQWDAVSNGAKSLIRGLLQKDPEARLSASQALAHPWLLDARTMADPLPPTIQTNLRKFVKAQRFKQAALSFIASTVRCKEMEDLAAIFDAIDAADGREDGRVPLAALQAAAAGSAAMLDSIDVDGDGSVSLGEFIAAALDQTLFLDDANIQKAYNYFDGDGNGTIDVSELAAALGQQQDNDDEIERILAEVDSDGDGHISFDEFQHMMRAQEM